MKHYFISYVVSSFAHDQLFQNIVTSVHPFVWEKEYKQTSGIGELTVKVISYQEITKKESDLYYGTHKTNTN